LISKGADNVVNATNRFRFKQKDKNMLKNQLKVKLNSNLKLSFLNKIKKLNQINGVNANEIIDGP